MMVPADRARDVLVSFLSAEMDKISNPVQRFMASFSLGAMTADVNELVSRASGLGIVRDGCIDTTAVRNGLETAFMNGRRLEAFGLVFGAEDGERIVSMMER